MVQALSPIQTLRAAYPAAELHALTTPGFADFLSATGIFSKINTKGRPKGLVQTLALFKDLRREAYDLVVDLQTSSRTKNYIFGFWPNPPLWSGISPGASHRQTRPDRDDLHNLDRMADQLSLLGVCPRFEDQAPALPDLEFCLSQGLEVVDRLGLLGVQDRLALLVPGASMAKMEKFWPAAHYESLAQALRARNLTPVVIGAAAEKPLAQQIPSAVDLTGQTTLYDLAALGRLARLSVGNDTGPMHLIAYAGTPSVMLMSKVSRPSHCAPRGPRAQTQWVEDLKDLKVETVLAALDVAGKPT